MTEQEFSRTNKAPFDTVKAECIEVETDGLNLQHVGVLNSWADAILIGGEMIANGKEGINGLTISNAIHLSSWKGEAVNLKDFPHDEFYEMLQEKIKNSTVDKSHIKNKVNSVAGTFKST
jgi:hypothetical protein